MVNDKTIEIKRHIRDFLISNIAEISERIIKENEMKHYILDIGSLLYKDGKNINNYTLFPYGIWINEMYILNEKIYFYFRIAITFGEEKETKTKDGYILLGEGTYYNYKGKIELKKKSICFMRWNTDIELSVLQEKAKNELFPNNKAIYNNEDPKEIMDEKFKIYPINDR